MGTISNLHLNSTYEFKARSFHGWHGNGRIINEVHIQFKTDPSIYITNMRHRRHPNNNHMGRQFRTNPLFTIHQYFGISIIQYQRSTTARESNQYWNCAKRTINYTQTNWLRREHSQALELPEFKPGSDTHGSKLQAIAKMNQIDRTHMHRL